MLTAAMVQRGVGSGLFYKNTADAFTKIVRQEGAKALYKGFTIVARCRPCPKPAPFCPESAPLNARFGVCVCGTATASQCRRMRSTSGATRPPSAHCSTSSFCC